jgi:hypothetical protein
LRRRGQGTRRCRRVRNLQEVDGDDFMFILEPSFDEPSLV